MMDKKKVIFICTHNSCRSQMAEGILKHLYGSYYESYSAGTEPGTINSNAIKIMEEIGIDISENKSKSINELRDKNIDIAVTVCDSVKNACPYFPAKKVIHKSFKDPSQFKGGQIETTHEFRRSRDEIYSWIEENIKP